MPNSSKTPHPSVPDELAPSVQVILRFGVRMIVFVLFALASRHDFATILEGSLRLATCYCLVAATFRRETVLSPVLTHFDEAAGYAMTAALASLIA